ncbi:MAG TPA: MarR family transcriptional regulator [Sphingobacteriaceae bacterium]|nr:MarR family transcriptional regulator [Sphingobacteriaceae bacterium]
MANELFGQYSHLLDRTARKVKQYAQRRFNEENFDITVDQWLVIKNLNTHNDKNQSELAELIGKDHPTFTRIVDLICKKGFIERKPHATDRRSFILHLTDEGKKRVEEWSPKMAEIRAKAWEKLTQDDYENLRRILNTIYNNLDV